MRTAKSIVELFEIVKDSEGKDWEHNKIRLEEIIEEYRSEQLMLNGVGVQSEQLCGCAMPDPIDPFAEVDKDTCKKCNNLIA